jgi:hypothetical protein
MSYNLRIPPHKIDSIFGSAYPSLSLKREQKFSFLRNLLGVVTGCKVDTATIRRSELAVAIDSKGRYDIDIYVDDTKGYNIAIAVEKWVDAVPDCKRRNLFQFLRRPRRGAPVDSYLIPTDNSFKVLSWLNENCTVDDYQLYSKFGSDVSVGFKSTDHSTLFKLAFVGIHD